MDLFLGVDGSGAFGNETYAKVFSDSFVKRLANKGPFMKRHYLRGPSMTGVETMSIVVTGYAWMKTQVDDCNRHKQQYRVFMAGYSRGGAAVVEIAHRLKAQGIKVHTLLLFDAVDQSLIPDARADVIPSNVSYAFHAMRDPKAGSREFFGNCAKKFEGNVQAVKRYFFCTHGAMGGTPWSTVGKTGKIEEMTDAEKAATVAGVGLTIDIRKLNETKKQADIHDFTNVTLDKEKSEGEAVWKWMNEKLSYAMQMSFVS